MSKKVILMIMDGWGLGKVKNADAIQNANVPFVSSLYNKYPNTTLVACGEAVGLPDGQMGNSEVGHLNLGAGRIVYQELQRINVAIKDGSFATNKELLSSIQYAKEHNTALHLIGLVSNGGVHSHINHLKAIIDIADKAGLTKIFIHAFTDGRDCDPKSGFGFIKELQEHIANTHATIASIIGRYYAMDRDKRWERIQLAYNALAHAQGEQSTDLLSSIQQSYDAGITDEFLKPIINANLSGNDAQIKNDDAVICFNFRTDRCREITQVLTQQNFPEYNMHSFNLHYTTMTEYDATYKNVYVIFENDNLNNTLGEVLSLNKKKQIRIAETEKYPHVTFFFSGGREKEFEGETRMIVPSPKVATYDLQPEMSALGITEKLLPELEKETADFICLNFANPDMVGHTGVFSAVIKALETVDACVQRLITTALLHNYTILLTADHGNADYMINEDGSPNTQHSLNLVPLFVIDNEWKGKVKQGKLGDIAPTILHIMQLPIPKEMTGNILIEN
ncbi:MAG: 2,3-bisphosphoglycerate-independent phosphoglycerate mutase [Chitinophagaceae bacterium]|nr:2,3-bisphosphoglycerate-independent phosphoglycerate mutase [Chitinophagaceae bacterium]MCW5904171.1 2,3-bisphosphoglycerate-independent phosphoglycerate mutase [Chitinophagaceae bacterium]